MIGASAGDGRAGKKLFLDFSAKRSYGIQGTGPGMAITKSPMDLMGGSIKVTSKPGEGSTFTVVPLDWKMPHLSGLETARLIRERYDEKIPILLLTAYDWSDIEREATEAGVRHFMPKPFFMSTFKNAVSHIMDNMKAAIQQVFDRRLGESEKS